MASSKEIKKRKASNRVSSRQIVRRFTADPEQGMAAMIVGSTAEGLPLYSMTRKGNRVVAVYKK